MEKNVPVQGVKSGITDSRTVVGLWNMTPGKDCLKHSGTKTFVERCRKLYTLKDSNFKDAAEVEVALKMQDVACGCFQEKCLASEGQF
jgi:hypothetical protein